eukprot:TRINITY_DN2225_c3_g1_i3.p1 TRINITY_DN2225_c3_g1~~TRINITY_DN2225_c3_g1_i3.p1  ORF type:complete len:540 (-),score=110.41 TRINITY_DN2225_c3_g1_i3:323-1942(-)
MSKKKILVCGSVRGQFDKLWERVSAIQKGHGAFDALLCVGEFFADENSLEQLRKSQIPVVTYFICTDDERKFLPQEVKLNGGEICPSVTYLGDQGIKEICGLNITYLSGYKDKKPLDYSEESVRKFLSSMSHNQYKGSDILLTNHWPQGILSNISSNENAPVGISMLEYNTYGSKIVSEAASVLLPRYHFSSNQQVAKIFYERPPYENGAQFTSQRNCAITRFLSLGDAFNEKKQRFLYAFQIQPINGIDPTELYQKPPHTTPFPFEDFVAKKAEPPAKKQKVVENSPSSSNKRDEERFSGSYTDQKPSYARQQHRPQASQRSQYTSGQRAGECWFCLSSSVFEHHLIVTLGTHFYVTLAKGGLTDSHMIISPIKHLPNQMSLSPEAVLELNKWKDSMRKFFSSKDEEVVMYELNWPVPFQHLQIHVISVNKSEKNRIREFYEHEAKIQHIDFTELKHDDPLSKEIGSDQSYFWVQLPDKNQLVARLDNKLIASFGRRCIAQCIGHPELEDWTKCVQPRHVEESLSSSMRVIFKPFQIK